MLGILAAEAFGKFILINQQQQQQTKLNSLNKTNNTNKTLLLPVRIRSDYLIKYLNIITDTSFIDG